MLNSELLLVTISLPAGWDIMAQLPGNRMLFCILKYKFIIYTYKSNKELLFHSFYQKKRMTAHLVSYISEYKRMCVNSEIALLTVKPVYIKWKLIKIMLH